MNNNINFNFDKLNDNPNNEIFTKNINSLFTEIKDIDFTTIGKIGIKKLFNQSFKLRNRFLDYTSKQNSINSFKIKEPIFVTGLPRSGTTFLHNLLIHAFNRDGLEFWELCEPIPYSKNIFIDKKFRKMRTFILYFLYRTLIPKLQLMHPVKITSYEECWHLFKLNLGIYNLDFQYNINNYGKWISENTIDQTYSEYKMLLKIISINSNKNKLVLKCPEHMLYHKQLTDNFKDGKILWIHRDPVKVISSYSSMTYEIQKFFLKNTSKKSVGEYVKNKYFEMINICLKNRSKYNLNIIDINYVDLKNNPEQTILTLSNNINVKIKTKKPFLGIKNLNKLKSRHKYTPEEFGLKKNDIYRQFDNYIKQFKIQLEF